MDPCAMECATTEPVWLRLVRGDAHDPVRTLPAELADGAVSVGTAASCDWRIEADGVPPVALHLKAIAGSLFVRAAGPAALRVDGHEVGSIWVPVERGARVAIGDALIEVGLAGRSRRAQHALLQRGFDQPLDRASEPPPVAPLAGRCVSPDAVREPARELELPARAENVWAAHESPQSLQWSATIFGADDAALAYADDDRASSAAFIRTGSSTSLLIAGSLLACAYGCWVLLLDFL
jgi:predicted component of type VI protein secretion system